MGEKDCETKKLLGTLTALKFAYFAYYFSVGCIHNFYPVLLKKIKVPNSQIGILASIGLIGGTMSPIIIGYLADKTKKSRLILILICTFTIIIHAIPITTISIKIILDGQERSQDLINNPLSKTFVCMLFVFQFFVTFGDQGTKALMDGVVHKVLGECSKAGIPCDFARLRMFGGVGIGTATILSGICLDHVKKIIPHGVPEELSLVVICLTMGTSLVIVLIINVPNVETKDRVSFISALISVTKRVDVLICFGVQFLIQFALNITRHFESLYIQHLGGNKTWMGIVTFVGYLSDVLMMYLSPTIIDAIGSREATIGFGSLISVVRCIFYGFADSKYMSMNNAILTGFSLGLIIPTMSSLVKSKAPENLISSYVSLLTATGKVGASIASYFGGVVSEKYSYTMIYIISSIFFILSTIIIISFRNVNFFIKNSKEKERADKVTCTETTKILCQDSSSQE